MAQLGKYELIRRLAAGGMAELYLASDTGPKGFKRRVVLKKILPQFADDQSFVAMFLSEARITGGLNHPNIAQVYEVGESDGAYFIAMEYVDGPNLRTLGTKAKQAGQPIDPFLAAKIISQACEGLGYAHELNDPDTGEPLRIVHRDISPDNIIVSRTGSVKVVDFGIAKATSQSHQTQTGVVKGKPAYMAPEQMARKQVDPRADIYSLGVVLYELLSGARPYEAENDVALIHAILLQEPIVPLAQRRAGLPEKLLAVVDKALERDVQARYQSCKAMLADLEKLLHAAPEPVVAQDIARLVADLRAEPAWGKLLVTPPTSSSGGSSARKGTPATAVARSGSTRPPPPPQDAEDAGAGAEEEAGAAEEGESSSDSEPQARTDPELDEAPPHTTDKHLPDLPRGRKGPQARSSKMPLVLGAAALLLAGIGVLAFTVREGGGQDTPPAPPVAAAPKPQPAQPAPGPAPVQDPAPQPPEPTAEQFQKAVLTIESRPGAIARFAGFQGKVPLTEEMEPGDVKVEVSHPEEGWSKVEWVRGLKPGERRTRDVRPGKVEVLFRSVPEAKVFVDGKQVRGPGQDGDLTPIRVHLYEGKHQVRFVCANGTEGKMSLSVVPSSQKMVVDGTCNAR